MRRSESMAPSLVRRRSEDTESVLSEAPTVSAVPASPLSRWAATAADSFGKALGVDQIKSAVENVEQTPTQEAVLGSDSPVEPRKIFESPAVQDPVDLSDVDLGHPTRFFQPSPSPFQTPSTLEVLKSARRYVRACVRCAKDTND